MSALLVESRERVSQSTEACLRHKPVSYKCIETAKRSRAYKRWGGKDTSMTLAGYTAKAECLKGSSRTLLLLREEAELCSSLEQFDSNTDSVDHQMGYALAQGGFPLISRQ